MLVLRNVEVTYQNVMLTLRGVSLEVREGSIVALLGAQGAGKSTTMKAISGLLPSEGGRITHGSIEFDGQPIHQLNPEDIAKLGIIQVMQGRRIFRNLSVEDNLRAGAYMLHSKGKTIHDLDRVYEYFPRLKMLRSRVSGYLSGGEQQMLVIGRGLMANPRLMILDEPSLGLAPLLVEEIFTIVQRVNAEEHTSMLLVEKAALAALEIAETGYVIDVGRIVLSGPASVMMEDDLVKRSYLGLGQQDERRSYKDIKYYRRRKRWLV